jgi:hypothetical protein
MAGNPNRPTILGVRRIALIEIAAYVAATLLVDHFAFGGDRFWSVTPHPFWPLILLMAVQYGTSEALLATALCSAALLAGNMPTQSINQDIYAYLLSVVRLPFMWMVAALVLGEIRMRHVRERADLEAALEKAVEENAEVSSAFERISAIRQSLEGRIASQLRTAVTMYQAARSLDRQDPSEVLLGVVDTILAILNPTKCSLYLLREDFLEISIGHGWTREDNLTRVFRPDSSLFQEVIGKQRVLCAVNPDDEFLLSNEGVIAGPLIDRGTGAVLGMLKIEELGFLDLHFSNIQTFQVLCDWIADSYLSAQHFEAARDAGTADQENQILTYTAFERQKAYLQRLAEPLQFDLSMIVIRAENADEIGGRKAASIPGVLKERSAALLRPADLLCEYQPGGLQYCILLPGTTVEQSEQIAMQLAEGLKGPEAERIAPARFNILAQPLHQKVAAS